MFFCINLQFHKTQRITIAWIQKSRRQRIAMISIRHCAVVRHAIQSVSSCSMDWPHYANNSSSCNKNNTDPNSNCCTSSSSSYRRHQPHNMRQSATQLLVLQQRRPHQRLQHHPKVIWDLPRKSYSTGK